MSGLSKFQKHELALNYIQTTAIVVGVIFGLVQIHNAFGQFRVERAKQTASILLRFADQDTIASSAALLAAATAQPKGVAEKNRMIVKLAPLHQLLIAWTACVANHLCDEDGSVNLLCARVISFEYAVKTVYLAMGTPYNAVERDEQYSGFLTICQQRLIDTSDAGGSPSPIGGGAAGVPTAVLP